MFRLVHLNVSSCKNLSNAGVRAICQIAPQLETLVLSNCQNISMETARFVQLYYYQLLHPQHQGEDVGSQKTTPRHL